MTFSDSTNPAPNADSSSREVNDPGGYHAGAPLPSPGAAISNVDHVATPIECRPRSHRDPCAPSGVEELIGARLSQRRGRLSNPSELLQAAMINQCHDCLHCRGPHVGNAASSCRESGMGQREDRDALSVPLEDSELLEELELLARLMIAANHSEGPLCQTALDGLLHEPPAPSCH